MTDMGREVETYRYRELCHGPPSTRKLIDISKRAPPQNAGEMYHGIYLYSDQSFGGPCTTDALYFDLDEKDPDKAREDCIALYRHLETEFDYQLGHIWVSGRRGFHAAIPAGVFGGFEPSIDLPAQLLRLCNEIASGAGIHVDQIHKPRGLIRVENSLHPKSGKYKVPITPQQLLALTGKELRNEVCRKPVKPGPHPGLDDCLKNDALALVWKQVRISPEPKRMRRQRQTAFSDQLKSGASAGERNTRCAQFVGKLRATGTPKHDALQFALGWNVKNSPPMSESEVRGVVESVYQYPNSNVVQEPPDTRSEISTTIADVKNTLKKWLHIDDDTFVDVVLATIVAHDFPEDPVWLFLVGPPGSTKTELLRSLKGDRVYTLSTLTEHSLISGLRISGDKDPSLLPKLDGKVLVIKDFTSVLSGRRETRMEIFGQLRDIYDGYCEKSFGSGVGVRSYKCHLGILAAVTPEIDRYHSVDQLLGERFLKLRLTLKDPDKAVEQAMDNVKELSKMRSEICQTVQRFFQQITSDSSAVTIPAVLKKKIVNLASLVALLRTAVPKNRQGKLEYMPVAEVGTRLAIQFTKLGSALCLVRNKHVLENNEYQLLVRIGKDSLPSLRRDFITRLTKLQINEEGTAWKEEKTAWHPTQEIGEATNVSTDNANTILHDLFLLGIVKRQGSGRFEWQLTNRVRDLLTKSGTIAITTQQNLEFEGVQRPGG